MCNQGIIANKGDTLEQLLCGGDLRSIGKSNVVVLQVRNQHDFDALFGLLYHQDRRVVMRAADAIEKITARYPEYLTEFGDRVFELCETATNKELKWHLAQLIPRLVKSDENIGKGKAILTRWAFDKANSRIVRVNAIQGLFELSDQKEVLPILAKIEQENIPSLNARIRILRELYDFSN